MDEKMADATTDLTVILTVYKKWTDVKLDLKFKKNTKFTTKHSYIYYTYLKRQTTV